MFGTHILEPQPSDGEIKNRLAIGNLEMTLPDKQRTPLLHPKNSKGVGEISQFLDDIKTFGG